MLYRKILALLRTAGLVQAIDLVRFVCTYLLNLPSNRRFQKAFPGISLSPAYMLYESFRMDYRKYWESGRETANWIKTETAPFLPSGQKLEILDWGCGPARVLRHLPEAFGRENAFFGTDYNPATVKWCKQVLEHIAITDCPFLPPTQYKDHAFDLIYGISIFTHFPEDAHYRWREELFRISKPGAVLLLTTQGPAFLEKLAGAEQRLFMENKLVIRGNTREGHRTFSAFHPETWVRDFFNARFEILRYIPGKKASWGIAQDTWILRRP